MAKQTFYVCDLCGATHTNPTIKEDQQAARLIVEPIEGDDNGQDIHYAWLCLECRRYLSEGIEKLIQGKTAAENRPAFTGCLYAEDVLWPRPIESLPTN